MDWVVVLVLVRLEVCEMLADAEELEESDGDCVIVTLIDPTTVLL